MQVQRVVSPVGDDASWTVLGSDWLPIVAVEELLAHLADQQRHDQPRARCGDQLLRVLRHGVELALIVRGAFRPVAPRPARRLPLPGAVHPDQQAKAAAEPAF
jgi:hypothetical protein